MVDSRKDDYFKYGIGLYKAALSGNWGAAAKIHRDNRTCFTEKITKKGDTALHIAAVAGHAEFVSQLVTLMVTSRSRYVLRMTNHTGNTALCFAAVSGVVAIAKTMVEARRDLILIRNNYDLTPLLMAAMFGHRDMVNYLLSNTLPDELSLKDQSSLFISTINTDLYDIALVIIRRYPNLATVRDDETEETPLHVLAKKSQKCDDSQGLWSRFFRKCKEEKELEMKLEVVKALLEIVLKEDQESQSRLMTHPWRLLFKAVEVGNVEFVTTLVSRYPDLIWKLDDKNRSIFHVAVQFRRESIFRLIFEIGAIKDLLVTYVDEETSVNILHLAALIPSSDRLNCVSGAALQMQREILWFKVVEDIVQPQLAESKNKDGLTAKDVFTEQHKDLLKEGEEWLRKTAGSCSVVATLIVGVAFGAALKSPANQGVLFRIFLISDSLSLIFSTASVLMFLSILTSRYAEKKFLQSLPQKLMAGLTLLFISIFTMMVAFIATFQIVFNHRYAWIATSLLSCIPILLFGLQEFPLLFEVLRSTIDCKFIFKPRNQLFPLVTSAP
ncbi:uncharacterized protein LOC141618630 isoform X2 [Silene latifolia]|uniref:uncharacterized protein LOC141618630 isoform X2 n=1 Tax=Silene latifolia TaxID=37657 RepID=UPI003D789BB3